VFIYSSRGKWIFPPLLWNFPPTVAFTSFPAPDCWVVLLLLLASVFVYSSHGRWVFSLSCGVFLPLPLSQAFPLLVAGRATPLLPEPLRPGPACLFTVPGRIPLPPLWSSGCPTLFAMCLHCFYCLLLSFSFFPRLWTVCPGGFVDLAQGCLWEYCIPLSSLCPHLPKPSGCR
jgi:hypothetical protein